MKKIFFICLLFFSVTDLSSQSWLTINKPADSNFLYDFILMPGEIIAVDDILGVWITSDFGKNWSRTLNTHNVLRMQGHNLLYALGGADGAFIYESNEAGTGWTNLAKLSINRPFVTAIASKSPDELFALGTMFGGVSPLLFKTTDHGTSWDAVSPNEAPYLQSIIPGSGSMLYGLQLYGMEGSLGFYRSTNNGESWELNSNGITSPVLSSLVMKGTDILFVSSTDGKLFKSADKGTSWESITNSFPNTAYLSCLTVSYAGDMYLSASVNSFCTIYRSSDDGITWSAIGDPVETAGITSGITSIAVTPRNTIIFCAEVDYSRKLFTNDSLYTVSGITQEKEIPEDFYLGQNFPNPFNPSTEIEFSIGKTSFVSLKVYDLLGREISSIVSEVLSPGRYTRQWKPENLNSGVYFYTLQSESFLNTKKMIYLK